MGSIGLNVSRDGRHDPALIRSLGATWIRIVAMPAHDLSDYFRRARAAGLKILLVLARESGGDYAEYQRRYGSLVDAVQVGNEADLESPSSWTMPQDRLMALGRAARSAFPNLPLVCSGLASGHPEWLDGADLSWCDAVACHPYAKDAENPTDLEDQPDAQPLIREYTRFGKPVLVTEWGWPDTGEPRGSAEIRDMIRWAAQTDEIEAFFYFCLSDDMVEPFGLLRDDGSEKPRAGAFKAEAKKAIHSLWPYVDEPPIVVVPEPAPAGPDPWRWWDAATIAATIRCPEARIVEHWPRISEQLNHCGIYELPVAAAMLGTVAIETAHRFEPIHEFRNADGSIPSIWYSYDGGPDYHGRGFIQLTHRSNYAAYGPKIATLWGAGGWEPDFNLVGTPDNALNPDISAAVSALYFRDHGGGAIPPAARAGDWREVRRLVQGGSAGLADFTRYAAALVASARPDRPPVPVDRRDELIAGYEIALRTLRDVTLPAIRVQMEESEFRLDAAQSQLDEARRIVAQMVGNS